MSPRRRQAVPLEVHGETPPQELGTVWHHWHPARDGPTVAALRAYLIAMDQFTTGGPVPEQDLAQLMLAVWQAATLERHEDI